MLDRLRGVANEVQQHLVDLRRRAVDFGHLAGFMDDGDAALVEDVADNLQRALDQPVDVGLVHAGPVDATEVLEIDDKVADLADAVHGVVEQRTQILQRRGVDAGTQALDVAQRSMCASLGAAARSAAITRSCAASSCAASPSALRVISTLLRT